MSKFMKRSIIILVVAIILSIAFAVKSNATEYAIIGSYSNEYGELEFSQIEANIRGRLIIESLAQHSYSSGDYITLAELYEYYDVLCCMHGTKLPSENTLCKWK
jgi:hypothetical protein